MTTKQQQIIDLATENLNRYEIASALNTSRSYVETILQRARLLTTEPPPQPRPDETFCWQKHGTLFNYYQ